jgi:hypothetical protein
MAFLALVGVVAIPRPQVLAPVSTDSIPLPFDASISSLKGSLTDIGSKDGITLTNVTFGDQEVSEHLPANHMLFVTTPTTLSAGAQLSIALTTNKKIFGYKYTSKAATTERQRRSDADQGHPHAFPELFPGEFFASDEQRSFDATIPFFESDKHVVFHPLSAVTLDPDARYVIVANDPDTIITIRGLTWCGDGKISERETCSTCIEDSPCSTGMQCQEGTCVASPLPCYRYTTGNEPNGIVSLDWDHDGRRDIAVSYAEGNAVSVYLGNGDGTFQSRQDIPLGIDGYLCHDLVAGDFWHPDTDSLALACDVGVEGPRIVAVGKDPGDAARTVYLSYDGQIGKLVSLRGDGNNNGVLVFSTTPFYTGGTPPGWGVLATSAQPSGDFLTGNFAPTYFQYLNKEFNVADLDGDHSIDVIVNSSHTTDGMRVGSLGIITRLLSNDPQWQEIETGTNTSLLNPEVVTDIDGDGKSDIIATTTGRPAIITLLNAGDGRFFVRNRFSPDLIQNVYNMRVVDFNGDGHLDIILGSRFQHDLAVYFGNGNGTFSYTADVRVEFSRMTTKTAADDFNGDGKVDFAVVHGSGFDFDARGSVPSDNTLSVFLNGGSLTCDGTIR